MQDHIQAIAKKYPEITAAQIEDFVKSGEAYGLSLEARLVGVRLCLAVMYGKTDIFTLADVAAALDCSEAEAADELKRQGIQGATLSTLPGFEWLLGNM